MSQLAAATPRIVRHPHRKTVEKAIEARDLRFAYPGSNSLALDVEELVVRKGERVALVGENGCGKTTLLRVLNGSLAPREGVLAIGGRWVSAADFRQREFRRRVAFVFQELHLVARATAFENVLWGRLGYVSPLKSMLGFFSSSDRSAASAALSLVALQDVSTRRVDSLSGGQKQRVAIARALAQDPELLLADEPVSSLDPARAEEGLKLLGDLCRDQRRTLVTSLHQPDLALRHAERIIGMRRGRLVLDEAADRITMQQLLALYDEPDAVSPQWLR